MSNRDGCFKHRYFFQEYETTCPYCVAEQAMPDTQFTERTILTRAGWLSLIDGNIDWASKLPRTLERDHVVEMLTWARDHRGVFERELESHERAFRLERGLHAWLAIHRATMTPEAIRQLQDAIGECDCHLYPNQVCDICQHVTGKEKDVEAIPIPEPVIADFQRVMSKAEPRMALAETDCHHTIGDRVKQAVDDCPFCLRQQLELLKGNYDRKVAECRDEYRRAEKYADILADLVHERKPE